MYPPASARRRGFTLIEIVLVMVLISLMALIMAPRGLFSFETPLRQLQQSLTELTDMALSGISVRIRLDAAGQAEFGELVIEALVKVEDPFFANRYTLEWKPVNVRHLLTGNRWKLEPEIVYFYTDGSCTPARILNMPRGGSRNDSEVFLLTVTGFLFEEKQN